MFTFAMFTMCTRVHPCLLVLAMFNVVYSCIFTYVFPSSLLFCYVNTILHMFKHAHLCLPMLPLHDNIVYTYWLVFTYVYQFTHVYSCLTVFDSSVMHVYPCLDLFTRLFLFTTFYTCLPICTCVCLCLPLFPRAWLCMFTPVYLCLIVFNCLAQFSHARSSVHHFLHGFTYVYPCLPMFTHVHLCLPLFTSACLFLHESSGIQLLLKKSAIFIGVTMCPLLSW